MGGQLPVRRASVSGTWPCTVIKPWGIPPRNFTTGIINLTVKRAVGNDCRLRGFPAVVGHNSLGAAIGIGKLKLAEETRCPERAYPPGCSIVKTVPEYGTYGIIPLTKHAGYIIGKIHHTVTCKVIVDYNPVFIQVITPGIVREIGHKQVITYFLAVDMQLKITQSCHKGFRLYQIAADREFLSQQWCRIITAPFLRVNGFFVRFPLPRCADPTGFPTAGIGKSHPPGCGLAPIRSFPVIVPHHDTPEIILAIFQCGTGILHEI